MVYDADADLLTIAGGRGFGDDANHPCRQVWQVNLYVKNSKWEALPDLPYGVYDPVLLSDKGTLYVLGGYSNPVVDPEPANATKRCVVLHRDEQDWQHMRELVTPLDTLFGGGGVIQHGTIYIITTKMAQKYDKVNDMWICKMYESDEIFKCTPVVDPGNQICAIAYCKPAEGINEVVIAEYIFENNEWKPEVLLTDVCDENLFDIETGAGRFLSLKLPGMDAVYAPSYIHFPTPSYMSSRL